MNTRKASRISQLRIETLQSRDVVELLADKWRIPILHVLENRVLRRHQLQDALRQVSPKMLTQTLRDMERDGLVQRMTHPVAPPHVEYALTKLGRSVIKPLRTLCRWAESHARERDTARERFDAAAKRIRPSAVAQSPKYR